MDRRVPFTSRLGEGVSTRGMLSWDCLGLGGWLRGVFSAPTAAPRTFTSSKTWYVCVCACVRVCVCVSVCLPACADSTRDTYVCDYKHMNTQPVNIYTEIQALHVLIAHGMSFCLSVCLSVCLPACLPACLPTQRAIITYTTVVRMVNA